MCVVIAILLVTTVSTSSVSPWRRDAVEVGMEDSCVVVVVPSILVVVVPPTAERPPSKPPPEGERSGPVPPPNCALLKTENTGVNSDTKISFFSQSINDNLQP